MTWFMESCVGPIDVPFAPAGKLCSNTMAAAPVYARMAVTNGTPADVAQLNEVLLKAPRLSAPVVDVTDWSASVPFIEENVWLSQRIHVGALRWLVR